MKKILSFIATVSLAASVLCAPAYADSSMYRIDDLCDKLSSSEELELQKIADQLTDYTGFNVIILISDDVGSDKSDRAVVDYADCYYDNWFGVDTDGILLLINEDTNYDIISSSGICLKYYTDSRIDQMFDYFYDYVRSGDYYTASRYFMASVEKYYNLGIPGDQYTYDEDTGTVVQDGSVFQQVFLSPLVFIALVPGLLVSFVFYFGKKKSYSKIKPFDKRSYLDKNSVRYTEVMDQFVRSYTVSTNTSSSGGGSHGGGSRSSSHRSSSGGHHGGGGRHR